MNFKETVEEFDRMCKFYDDETENPFYEETNSDDWEDWWMWGIYHTESFNEIVEKFSREHPKPIYPTIGELVKHILSDIREEIIGIYTKIGMKLKIFIFLKIRQKNLV